MPTIIQVPIADDDIRLYRVEPNQRDLTFVAACADAETAKTFLAVMETPIAVSGAAVRRTTEAIAGRAKNRKPNARRPMQPNQYTSPSREWKNLDWDSTFKAVFAKYPGRTHLTLKTLHDEIQQMHGLLSKITVKKYIDENPEVVVADGFSPRAGSMAPAALFCLARPASGALEPPTSRTPMSVSS